MQETWFRSASTAPLDGQDGINFLSEGRLAFSTEALAKEVGISYRNVGENMTSFWLPCESRCNVDVSFSYFPTSLIRTLFRLRQYIEIAPGLYCYGRGAASAARLIQGDEKLVFALKKIVGWATSVHWTATKFAAVDSGSSIAFDGAGGRHFFEYLKSAASRLAQIDSSLIHSEPSVDTIQPSRLVAIFLAFVFAGGVPVCIYLISNAIAK